MKKLLAFIIFNCALINICYGEDLNLNLNDGTVYIEEEFLDSDILRVNIMVKDIMTPVIGISFHLQTDPEKIEFLRYEPGNFLERGADPFYLVRNKENVVLFGATLRKEDSFPIGDGIISSFYYQINDDQQIPLNFRNGVISSLDTIRQDLHNIVWENKVVSLSENENIFGLSDFYGKDTVIGERGTSKLVAFWPLTIVFGAIAVALFSLYLIKKFEHKRATSSVNFK